jgi:N-acyl homoserine lactone hydrolase
MFKFSIDREQEIDKQLLKIGINPNHVKAVVLTHLHLDHVDGLRHFPKAKVIVNKQEWKNPFGDLPKLYPEWFKPELIELDEKYQNFDHAFYLTDFKDLIAIHNPVHTLGSISVVLKTDDFDFAFAGDICYHQDQLINNSYAGINTGDIAARDTYSKFKTLAKTSKLVFLPSHDKEAGKHLKNLVTLSVS